MFTLYNHFTLTLRILASWSAEASSSEVQDCSADPSDVSGSVLQWRNKFMAARQFTSNDLGQGGSPHSSFNQNSLASRSISASVDSQKTSVIDTTDAYLSRLEDPQRAFLVGSESQMSFVRRTQVLYLGSVALASLLSAVLQIYHRYMCYVCVRAYVCARIYV